MIIYYENDKYSKHIEYAFETLLRCVINDRITFRVITDDCIIESGIYYGNNCPNNFHGINIREGTLFSNKYLKKESLPTEIMLVNNLPALYYNLCSQKDGNYCIIENDIIQNTFFFVTAYEEIVNLNLRRDKFDRIEFDQRFLFKICNYERPIVNEYAELLYSNLISLNFKINHINMKSYVHISHDVDIPFISNRLIRYINKKMDSVKHEFINFLHPGLKLIVETEKEFNIKSSWYFMSSGNHEPYDIKYNLNNRKILQFIEMLNNSNNEVGWHYSYDAAFDENLFVDEANFFKSIVNKSIIFGRNHFLRYSVPKTWEFYKNNNLYYDSTLGSAGHEGFIYGICTPFQLFDANKEENLGVWEIPLIVMDGTLFSRDYKNYPYEDALNSIISLLNLTNKYNGVFSILWHNSHLRDIRFKKEEKLYKYVMKLLSKSSECLTGCQIIQKYKDNVIY